MTGAYASAAPAWRGRRAIGVGVLALVFGPALSACSASSETPAGRRDQIVREATATLSARLEDALSRAHRALDALASPDAEAPASSTRSRSDERRARLDALERVRAATGVDGVLTEDSSGERAWAGRPVEPRELPAAKPWDDSFAAGDVVFHAGPFLRALLVSGPGPRGGSARVTVVLADADASPLDGTVETRWALEQHVRSVRVLPPTTLKTPAEPGGFRTPIPRGSVSPALALQVAAPDVDLVASLLDDEARSREGARWLVAGTVVLALLGVAARRRLVRPGGRAAAALALALTAREGLRLVDLSSRFPALEPGFRDTDFGLPGFLGWFETPADLALSGLAILLVALAIASIFGANCAAARPSVRRGAGVAATLLGGFAVRAWLELVEAAATQSRIDVFGRGTLVPSLPRALLLLGLCAATAAAFVLCREALRRVEAACAGWPRAIPRIVGAAAMLGAAALVPGEAPPAWTMALVPAAAAALGRLREGDARPGAPSRILMTSVVATLLLVPVLSEGAADALRGDVRAQTADWVRRESTIDAFLDDALTQLAADPHLAAELANTRRDPDELAFHVWLSLGFAAPDADGALVVVRDATGRRVSKFAMNVPPIRRLPWTDPPPEGGEGDDVLVERRSGPGDSIRTVAGHLRVRGPEGAVLGRVSVYVPDPLAVELSGAEPRIPVRATPRGGAGRERVARPLSLRLVSGGRVVATNDLHAPSTPPVGLPPAESLGQPRWLPPQTPKGRPWLAVDAGARGILVAEPVKAQADEVLFGIARVVIVGVGAGVALAVLALAAGMRRHHARLQDRILGSYFLISVVPLVFLGLANWREAKLRAEDEFRRRQEVLLRTARDDFQLVGTGASPGFGDRYTAIQTEAVALYRGGEVEFTGLPGLVGAELLPARLSSAAYRAVELEQRETFVEDTRVGDTLVRTAYAPMRGPDGTPFATVAVPVAWDASRAERQASETGSVLLAAYLLTLVLVVVIGIWTSRRLARPLQDLVAGTRRVAAGELGTAIPGAGRDEMGQLVEGFNAMTRDLAQTRELAARAERETAWRGMARQVAHEIKNPLTPMKLLLQQLAATARSDPGFAAAMIESTSKVVLDQIDALSRIASDFAAFARFPPRELRDCDVNAILRSVVALYGRGEGDQATVVDEPGEGLPPVHWDEDELRRVFVNLVANAVQAADERKGRVRVVVRSAFSTLPSTGRPAVLVTVSDDGVGIPVEHRARLFEPDFSTKTHGTGLGLAICRRILTDLAGEIRIESEPGVGTTVSTWFPTKAPPAV